MRDVRRCYGADCVFLVFNISLYACHLSPEKNLDSSVNMTLPQSDTVKLPCSWHHVNRVPLDWTDRGTQTRCT
ncbi:hypothetical protein TNCV_1473851 [Trichonephila clavipes]|nr:hypothetical protein TNCV_1473851 [Trichonephila clavipes]